MKEKPIKQPKIKFTAHIEYEGDEFDYITMAYDEAGALNNFLYQLAQEVNEPVPLLRWKYNNDKFDDMDIREAKSGKK
jgi:hypothetical protein